MREFWGARGFNRQVFAWAMYDWANSAFATTIMAAVLPNFYGKVAAGTLPPYLASSYWGYTNTLVMFVIAISAPILGAIADYQQAKKKFLAFFLGLGVFFTAFLYFIQTGDWLAASLFYIAARIGFASSNIFYDALLPHVAPKGKIDQVSVLGYAAGYLGGGLLLTVNLWMIVNPAAFGLSDAILAARWSFVTVSIWWGIFSIPLFLYVKEPKGKAIISEKMNPVKAGIRKLITTFKNIRRYRELFRFLIAFWLYNDGIGTIIVMAVIFGTEIGIGQSDLIGAILLVQFVGIPFSLFFGKLSEKFGTRGAIFLGLGVYTLISIGGYFLHTALHFWILAIMVGLVQGGTQALSRSLFGSMVPKAMSAEFFGFYDVSQKFSGILGPALFGVVGQLTGNSRLSIMALVLFFIGGGFLLLRVNVEEGRKLTLSGTTS